MSKTLGILVAALVALVGCHRAPPPQRPQPSVARSTNSEKPPPPPPPRDSSLSCEEYVSLGMPAHDRFWSGDDMERAVVVLEELAQEDMGRLPRHQSPRSGEMFARLVAADNVEVCRNRSIPIKQRMGASLAYTEPSNRLLKLYARAYFQRAIGGGDLFELYGAQLKQYVGTLEAANEFVATLDPNDPSYPVRMDGLRKMKQGIGEVVAGTLQSLTESHEYSVAERVRLIGHMQRTFPSILPELSPAVRQETYVRISKFRDDPAMGELRSAIDELIAAIETTKPLGPAP